MKVLHLLKHSRNGNGSVHVAVDLACAQVAAGHDVVIASSGGRYDSLLRRHGIGVETVPQAEGLKGAVRSLLRVFLVARRFGPDVVHAHMMSSAVIGFIVSAILRRPLVTTMHNSFDRHSFLMRLGRKVVAVSEVERRLLLDRGFPSGKVVTVLNGVGGSAREELEDTYLGPLHTPAIMTLSGLHRRKAVGDVITAFGLVAGEFPDWHLSIVGAGPDRPGLVAQAAELDIQDSVHFLGSTLTPIPLLGEAAIFATAALAEPFGLAVAEARMAGCAIVATEVGGIPEVLDGGAAGLLVPTSDPSAMAAAFRSLMQDEELLNFWRARAVTDGDRFGVGRMMDEYGEVYRSVVRPGHRCGGSVVAKLRRLRSRR